MIIVNHVTRIHADCGKNLLRESRMFWGLLDGIMGCNSGNTSRNLASSVGSFARCSTVFSRLDLFLAMLLLRCHSVVLIVDTQDWSLVLVVAFLGWVGKTFVTSFVCSTVYHHLLCTKLLEQYCS